MRRAFQQRKQCLKGVSQFRGLTAGVSAAGVETMVREEIDEVGELGRGISRKALEACIVKINISSMKWTSMERSFRLLMVKRLEEDARSAARGRYCATWWWLRLWRQKWR